VPFAISCINVELAPHGSLFVASRTCHQSLHRQTYFRLHFAVIKDDFVSSFYRVEDYRSVPSVSRILHRTAIVSRCYAAHTVRLDTVFFRSSKFILGLDMTMAAME
jgi:hypothetical protein